ncbi:type II toxin-antitoxin system RelE/ParE family toxin [Flavobacterium frigidarium]|uniref:type II toxin-antitoxin system RelE/ParE family toxin n=1 Tax=Flavobacterium frigidarium TaxID=99286 RepID=UPI00040E19D9|nr:type II toxin-antitoxin system RelE/ParE family toxin [Flavobacterium frigidarium]
MELKVYWTDFAKIELQHIYEFLKTTATIIVAKNTINDITNEVKLLSNHPYLGKIEELLVDRSRVFRVLISKDYKVIY